MFNRKNIRTHHDAIAQNIQTTFRATFSAAANQVDHIDPKEILKQETNHD